MMKKLALLSYITLLFGCGINDKFVLPKYKTYIDKAFLPYLNKWDNDIGISYSSLTIQFGTPKADSSIAECWWLNVHSKKIGYKIIVKQDSWDKLEETQKLILIYHELGHCVLNLTHNDKHDSDGCPQSIMRTYMFSKSETRECFEKNYNYYINELLIGE